MRYVAVLVLCAGSKYNGMEADDFKNEAATSTAIDKAYNYRYNSSFLGVELYNAFTTRFPAAKGFLSST